MHPFTPNEPLLAIKKEVVIISEYGGLKELKEVFGLNKEKFELKSKTNEVGNRIWRLKKERMSIGHKIAVIEKKVLKILKSKTDIKYIEPEEKDEDE